MEPFAVHEVPGGVRWLGGQEIYWELATDIKTTCPHEWSDWRTNAHGAYPHAQGAGWQARLQHKGDDSLLPQRVASDAACRIVLARLGDAYEGSYGIPGEQGEYVKGANAWYLCDQSDRYYADDGRQVIQYAFAKVQEGL